MYVLYRFLIPIYFFGIRCASIFRQDARLWVKGRTQFFENILAKKESIREQTVSRWIWFHCASLGEFEQGRVLIEKIKIRNPEIKIWLSFFSPSGYAQKKDYAFADMVSYFPSDDYQEAKKFIEIINPILVIFVKYDFWWNSLTILIQKEIPFIFVSSLFNKNHYLFSWWANSFRKILQKAAHIYLQDKESLSIVERFGFTNCSIVGDTRLDRILELAAEKKLFPEIESFIESKKVWVLGSIWREDILILKPIIEKAVASNWKIIIVPHQVDKPHIDDISLLLNQHPQNIFSTGIKDLHSPILIVDTIGMLSSIYHYANFVYVGGGFGASIHNVLEPLVFGKFVAFGPNHKKFPEARDMVQFGMGFEIKNKLDAIILWEKVNTVHFAQDYFTLAKRYIDERAGASEKIYLYLSEKYFKP